MTEQAQGSCERIEVLVHRFHWCTAALREWLESQAKSSDILCIVLGSTQSSPSGREPLPLAIRKKMRESCVKGLPARVLLLEMPDLLYQPQAWAALLQRKLDAALGTTPQPAKWLAATEVAERRWRYWFHHPDVEVAAALRGSLAQLPQTILDAEQKLQRLYFEENAKTASGEIEGSPQGGDAIEAIGMPSAVKDYVSFQQTPLWQQCQLDHLAVKKFIDKWVSAPYTPIFHTVDALVKCRVPTDKGAKVKENGEQCSAGSDSGTDYVLLIQRGRAPGKDLWAIPGGFLEPEESRYTGAVRELQEETGLDLSHPDLQADCQGHWVIDAPRRSARGRILTTLYVFDLGVRHELPAVAGADDAACAEWVTLDDVQAEACFEDHCFLLSQASLRFGWSVSS